MDGLLAHICHCHFTLCASLRRRASASKAGTKSPSDRGEDQGGSSWPCEGNALSAAIAGSRHLSSALLEIPMYILASLQDLKDRTASACHQHDIPLSHATTYLLMHGGSLQAHMRLLQHPSPFAWSSPSPYHLVTRVWAQPALVLQCCSDVVTTHDRKLVVRPLHCAERMLSLEIRRSSKAKQMLISSGQSQCFLQINRRRIGFWAVHCRPVYCKAISPSA